MSIILSIFWNINYLISSAPNGLKSATGALLWVKPYGSFCDFSNGHLPGVLQLFQVFVSVIDIEDYSDLFVGKCLSILMLFFKQMKLIAIYKQILCLYMNM
mgnify:CR=1 FL=1